ncbi:C-type mannose receptor 2 [Bulinus truncatus]|nr:C-type mannose receptor 2 [Bulinus truncatus]
MIHTFIRSHFLSVHPNWTQKDDVCYRYFSQQSTWHTAQSNCQSHGGHLISIHDDRTQSFIFSLMIRQKPISPIWLGLNDASVESRYQWSDESPFDFTLWSRGEPNSLSVSEDCTEMLPTDGKWNDNNCHVVRPYICAIQRSRPTPGIQTTLITVEEMVPECADKDWSYHDSFCYYIGTDFKSWNKARKYCVSKGGDLASILRKREQFYYKSCNF